MDSIKGAIMLRERLEAIGDRPEVRTPVALKEGVLPLFQWISAPADVPPTDTAAA